LTVVVSYCILLNAAHLYFYLINLKPVDIVQQDSQEFFKMFSYFDGIVKS